MSKSDRKPKKREELFALLDAKYPAPGLPHDVDQYHSFNKWAKSQLPALTTDERFDMLSERQLLNMIADWMVDRHPNWQCNCPACTTGRELEGAGVSVSLVGLEGEEVHAGPIPPQEPDKFDFSRYQLPTEHEREILDMIEEEAAEVIQRAVKLKRFGRDEIEPGHTLTNSQRMSWEIGNLLELVNRAIRLGLVENESIGHGQAEKARKLRNYMRTSPPGEAKVGKEAAEFKKGKANVLISPTTAAPLLSEYPYLAYLPVSGDAKGRKFAHFAKRVKDGKAGLHYLIGWSDEPTTFEALVLASQGSIEYQTLVVASMTDVEKGPG